MHFSKAFKGWIFFLKYHHNIFMISERKLTVINTIKYIAQCSNLKFIFINLSLYSNEGVDTLGKEITLS